MIIKPGREYTIINLATGRVWLDIHLPYFTAVAKAKRHTRGEGDEYAVIDRRTFGAGKPADVPATDILDNLLASAELLGMCATEVRMLGLMVTTSPNCDPDVATPDEELAPMVSAVHAAYVPAVSLEDLLAESADCAEVN
jgi:hypothetical protein